MSAFVAGGCITKWIPQARDQKPQLQRLVWNPDIGQGFRPRINILKRWFTSTSMTGFPSTTAQTIKPPMDLTTTRPLASAPYGTGSLSQLGKVYKRIILPKTLLQPNSVSPIPGDNGRARDCYVRLSHQQRPPSIILTYQPRSTRTVS
jgi:hypothetical protein